MQRLSLPLMVQKRISTSLRFCLKRLRELLEDNELKGIFNLRGSLIALLLSQVKRGFVWIDRDEEGTKRVFQDINLFNSLLRGYGLDKLFFLPSGEGPSSEGIRARVLLSAPPLKGLVTSVDVIERRFWKPELLIKRYSLFIKEGLEIERLSLVDRLVSLGYRKVAFVTEPGEFSLRNFIMEVFPSTAPSPLRIEFFGDEIETLRTFDIETQRSGERVQDFMILPARPPEPDEAIPFSHILELLFDKDRYLFLRDDKRLIERIKTHISEDFIVLADQPFITEDIKEAKDSGCLTLTGKGLLYNERKGIEELPENIKILLKDKALLIAVRRPAQAKRLKDLFFEHDLIVPVIPPQGLMDYEGPVAITTESPSSGFALDGFILLSENELFGPGPSIRPSPLYRLSKIFNEIEDLEEGDYVVHKIHGIGIYRGIERLKIEDTEEDLMIIEYRDGAKLYLPLRNISLIHKFRAQEGIIPEIDSLGGKTWKRKKQRIKERIKEFAKKLIKIYAEREIGNGHAFSPEGDLHREFASFFEYEETPDQLKAIEETLSDMESPRPMERLIVGDVGYGKTEVAMRAAFKAVFDHKQVALLVPTILLVEQHLRVFRQRFSAFPVRIDYLSRLKDKNEYKETLEALKRGEIDIIIGTQALLSEKVKFLDLGLLIIDEEHRFGVRHKERLKELKKGVDVLLLSATPIPRTLQMALSGMRSMSIIETPPQERQAIKTIISKFDREIIKKAIEQELERKGQVFFVHNRIRDIEEIKRFLEGLFPHIRIAIAHGEMDERLIEEVMLRFLQKEIELLVCTNIIGSGIDIPSANTILINRAHEFGLADLYQLRGRVGRSSLKAYCYLLIPPHEVITEAAKKRLEAIADLSYLGAGIRLAMTDLEIRGAGNLLGPEQSGHINAVGFELYTELLEKAIRELKGERVEEVIEPLIEIPLRASIPDTYVDEIHIRLNLYRRLSMADTEEALLEIEREMEERFGPLPFEVKNLLKIVRLKNLLKKMTIERLSVRDRRIEINYVKEMDREVLEKLLLTLKKTGYTSYSEGNWWLSSAGPKRIVLSHDKGVSVDAVTGLLSTIYDKIHKQWNLRN